MNILRSLCGRTYSNKNFTALFAVLVGAFCIAAMLSLLLGSAELDVARAISAWLEGDYADADYRILFYFRLPRTLAALLAGSALAVSGVIIQAVLANPMAAPNVIGVNSGAGLAATLMLAFFPNALSLLPFVSFAGALCTCMLIYAIAWKTSGARLTVTLVGIAVGSVLNAGINTVKVLIPDSVYDTDMFMIGGFGGITYAKLSPAWIIIALGIVGAVLLSRYIDVLCLGGAAAGSLGVNVPLLRFVLLVIASALAGAAVSFAGLLGFVGLLVPHIVRRFTGNRHGVMIAASALLGSVFVCVCDLLSRVLFAPYELPVGIILSVIGGIFFICLVLFGRKSGGYA